MTIDDRLAFGEHVSIPIRTEKTAEQKWIELRDILATRLAFLREAYVNANRVGDWETAAKASDLYNEVWVVMHDMDELDT